MTLIISIIKQIAGLARTYNSLLSGSGLVVILLLIALLVQKELLRTFDRWRSSRWQPALDMVIVSLVLAAGLMLFLRLLDLVVPL